MSTVELLVTRPSDEVAILTLNRPDRRNALSGSIVERLHDAMDAAQAEGVRLLVLQGEGPSFCSGFDLTDIERESDGDLLLRFVRIEMFLQRLFSASFVTLALAHGRIAGAGADLFAACDRRVIVENATFAFPGAGFGIVLGTGRLIAHIGRDSARQIVRSGQEISAAEALQNGLAGAAISRQDIAPLIVREREIAMRLDRVTASAIHAVDGNDGADDMAHLVWSASRPGLKERILAYRVRVRSARAKSG